MSSNKQKTREKNVGLSISKEKAIPVAENSQWAKPPGAQQPGSANVQSANREEEGAVLRDRPPLQTGSGGPEVGGRGGTGAQQAGWSSRQQAERIEARGEELRRGEPQQSGYGGLQQDQHAGSQESPTGPPGSWQTDAAHPHKRQGSASEPASAPGRKQSKRGGGESKQ